MVAFSFAPKTSVTGTSTGPALSVTVAPPMPITGGMSFPSSVIVSKVETLVSGLPVSVILTV